MRLSIRWSVLAHFLLALAGSSAVSGCGGAVNLGGNADGGSAIEGGTSPGITMVYEKKEEYFQGFAVDEATLYFSYAGRSEPYFFLQACDLGACDATVRTLYRANPESIIPDLSLSELSLAKGEIFFAFTDEREALFIMACPTTGCGGAPRKLTPAGLVHHLFATEEAVYWHDGVRLHTCAREGCSAPTSRNLAAIVRTAGAESPLNSLFVAGDFAYVASTGALVRLQRDLSAEPDWVYRSDRPIKGVAVSGDWVYFAIATHDGEVRRCPLAGCVGDPEVVASGQPRPMSLVVDERALHWLNYPTDSPVNLTGSVAAVTLDSRSTARILATGLKLRPDMRIRMNSHHVYWAETDSVPGPISQIRSIAK